MEKAKKILFVDDEPDIAKLVMFRLRREGYEVTLAQSGEEALRIVCGRPDLVLLDLWLPDIDGYEVCRRIKSEKESSNIPVIIFTASGSEVNILREKIREAGAQDYIIKPFETQELFDKIRKYISAGTVKMDNA